MAKKVSVILPVYNGAEFLAESINSILEQNFTDFELVIVNDGSRDESEDIIKYCDDSRIKVINRQENKGLVYSLNEGIAESEGKYIARQDADDISIPERLWLQVEYLDNNQSAGMVGSSYMKIDEQGRDIVVKNVPCGNEELQKILKQTNCFCHGSVMLRKGILEKVGQYRDTAGPTEDYDLWLRISENSEIANINKTLYKWRVSINSVMGFSDEKQASRSRAFLKKLAETRREQGIDLLNAGDPEALHEFERLKHQLQNLKRKPVSQKKAMIAFNIAEDFLKLNNIPESINYCLKAIHYSPLYFNAWKLLMGLYKRKVCEI